MKKIYSKLSLAVMLSGVLAITTKAQVSNVGIGTKSPDESAVLDIQSPNKGLLIPRMTIEQRNAIVHPADGLMIYQTGEESGFFYFDGKTSIWSPISQSEAKVVAAANADNWSKTGDAGTNSSVNFLGTTDNQPLVFKVNNEASGFISPTGSSMFFGYRSGFAGSGGSANVGYGGLSLESLSTGYSNTAFGYASLRKVTTGNLNLGIGGFTLNNLTTGTGNVAIGHGALVQNQAASDNVAIGTDALFGATSSNNVAIGKSALVNLTTAGSNLVIGNLAGNTLTTGGSNVLIGHGAASGETTITDKLYITNSTTSTPLIYGDFSAKFISVGDIELAKRDAIATSGTYGLLVEKGILTEKVKVALKSSGDWADYVFDPSYKLMSLEEVEAFTKENKHLPNVPSADEMAESGLDVSHTSKIFMEKIEELTLYMIELNNEVKALKLENQELKKLLE